jgi:hypothetical protein
MARQEEKLYAVKDLAELADVTSSTFHKWVKKQGYEPLAARDPDSHQIITALPESEAGDAIKLRKLQGFPVKSTSLARLSSVPPVRGR